jgi:hypothetical protein
LSASLPPLSNLPVTVFIAYNSPSSPQQDAMLTQLNLNLTGTFFTELNKIRINDYLSLVENNSNGAVICLPKFQSFYAPSRPKGHRQGIRTVIS